MTHPPLSWIPVLDLRQESLTSFALREAAVFYRAHQGRGHLLLGEPPPPGTSYASWSCTRPLPGQTWRSPVQSWEGLPVAASLEIAGDHAPEPAQDCDLPALLTQNAACRLTVYRIPGTEADAVIRAVSQIRESHPQAALWLDLPSMGWDAAAYLLAVIPVLQLMNVPDRELSHLLDLAEILERPVQLHDFGGAAPLPVLPLPEYPPQKDTSWDMSSPPVYPGYL